MDEYDALLDATDPESGARSAAERLRTVSALWIAVLAVLLAIAGLGGENAAETAVYNNILASDTFAWYQAKTIRQTAYQIAADEIAAQLARSDAGLTPAETAALDARLAEYLARVERYESEPDPADPDNLLRGEGQEQLLAQARHYQAERDLALAQDPNFDYAAVLYQIAIVLASVSILASSRLLLVLSGVLGVAATLLSLNGFLGMVVLPF